MLKKNMRRWAYSTILLLLGSACAASKLNLSLDFHIPVDASQKPFNWVLGVDGFIDIPLRLRKIVSNEIIWSYELQGRRVDKYNNIYQLSDGRDGKQIISYNISKILEEQIPGMLKSMKE